MTDLEVLRAAWEAQQDGATGNAYGEALEEAGLIAEAATVYETVIDLSYPIGYNDLAWLEHKRGNQARAEDLLEEYLVLDDGSEDFGVVVAGVLGGWRWQHARRVDAEPLLRAGLGTYDDVRADLALLLRTTDREDEAEELLRAGVDAGERGSYLPLANLLDESGRSEEAEQLYREGFELGYSFCAYNMYLMLQEHGRDDDAHQWLVRGAEAGDQVAIDVLAD